MLLSSEERAAFRMQERRRFANPSSSFTYHLQEGLRTVVVGPIKDQGTKVSAKIKAHPFLVEDRPSSVSLAALVRDAVARLPKGEGKRVAS